MKCPYCGYDKIQESFNFCPHCKSVLKDKEKGNADKEKVSFTRRDNPTSENKGGEDVVEMGVVNRMFSGWTYERAMSDPYRYAIWALRNPNDSKHFFNKWEREGNDITMLHRAINEARRARQVNPTADNTDVDDAIIDSNRNTARESPNSEFVDAVNSEPTPDAAAVVRNKAIWKLQAGELARHIAPDEWVYVAEHLEGLVVEEGTSAIVYVDGVEVAQMGAGMYVFDSKHSEAAKMEAAMREHEETKSFFKRVSDGLYRLFTGHRRNDGAQEREMRKRRVQQIIGRLKKDTVIDVYLKSDRIFPAIFGQQHLADTPEGYKPYIMQSRFLDVQVGVSMQMRIGDFKEFITNYMAGRKTVSIADMVRSVNGAVGSILRFELRDREIDERGLDGETFTAISRHLKTNLSNLLHGVVVIEVLDIATTSEALERFRKVEEKLYCSEREYDFLLRTNEFRNRLATEENDQKIREERAGLDLKKRLDDVNHDRILHDEEVAMFESLIENQRKIREATNDVELQQALWEIEHNRLISEEEFVIFKEDLARKTFDREQVSEQMRARSLMATALAKMDIDRTLNIANIQNMQEVSDAEFEALRKQKGHEAEGWDLESAVYGRQYVYERQKMLDSIEMRRIDNDYRLEEAQMQNRMGAVGIEGLRQTAEYRDEREIKRNDVENRIYDSHYEREKEREEDEYNRRKREAEDSINLDNLAKNSEADRIERASKMAMENMQTMMQHDAEMTKEEHEHEQKIKNIEAETLRTEINAEKEMGADQLLGKRIHHMDAAAQRVFAESFSHLKEIEIIQQGVQDRERLYEKMVDMAKQNGIDTKNIMTNNAKEQKELMTEIIKAFKEMHADVAGGQRNSFDAMLGAIEGVANGRINDQEQMKREYREQMMHEQQRTDENQKQSLNFTTRVRQSENNQYTAGGTSFNINVNQHTCPNCGHPITDKDSKCCPHCGEDL